MNTRSQELGTDDVADPHALVAWLGARALVPDGTHVTSGGHRRALRFREGLRALIAANVGIEPDPDDPSEGVDPTALADLAADGHDLPLVLGVETRPPQLEPRSTEPLDRALAGFLVAIADSVAAGTWPRFKVCLQPNCRWVYYDHSRNRSRAWCDMATCGNRAKAKAFRQRRS